MASVVIVFTLSLRWELKHHKKILKIIYELCALFNTAFQFECENQDHGYFKKIMWNFGGGGCY